MYSSSLLPALLPLLILASHSAMLSLVPPWSWWVTGFLLLLLLLLRLESLFELDARDEDGAEEQDLAESLEGHCDLMLFLQTPD